MSLPTTTNQVWEFVREYKFSSASYDPNSEKYFRWKKIFLVKKKKQLPGSIFSMWTMKEIYDHQTQKAASIHLTHEMYSTPCLWLTCGYVKNCRAMTCQNMILTLQGPSENSVIVTNYEITLSSISVAPLSFVVLDQWHPILIRIVSLLSKNIHC